MDKITAAFTKDSVLNSAADRDNIYYLQNKTNQNEELRICNKLVSSYNKSLHQASIMKSFRTYKDINIALTIRA